MCDSDSAHYWINQRGSALSRFAFQSVFFFFLLKQTTRHLRFYFICQITSSRWKCCEQEHGHGRGSTRDVCQPAYRGNRTWEGCRFTELARKFRKMCVCKYYVCKTKYYPWFMHPFIIKIFPSLQAISTLFFGLVLRRSPEECTRRPPRCSSLHGTIQKLRLKSVSYKQRSLCFPALGFTLRQVFFIVERQLRVQILNEQEHTYVWVVKGSWLVQQHHSSNAQCVLRIGFYLFVHIVYLC